MDQDRHRASDSGGNSCVNCMSSGHGLRGVISREDQETFEERLRTSIADPESVTCVHIFEGKEELTAWHFGGLAWWKQPRPSRDIMWTHMGSGGRGILLWSLCGFSRTWVWLLLLSDGWAGPWSPRGKEASMQPAAGFGRLISKQGLRRTVRSYNSHFIVMVLGSQSTEGGADLF